MKILCQAVASSLFIPTIAMSDIPVSTAVNEEALIRNAVPYNHFLRRRLEEGENQEYVFGNDGNILNYIAETYGDIQLQDNSYSRYQISPNHKVQFRSCVALETENYNLLLDNLVDYTKQKVLTSYRNYVLFDLCGSDDNCALGDNSFVVDLATFIQATIDYGPSEREKTCEACKQYQDTCTGSYQRRLEEVVETNCTYVVFDQETCDKCDKYNCWDDNQDANDMEGIEEWVTGYAECAQLDSQWNDLDLYAGWMCNEKGTGIEMGVFLDQYCTMHHTELDVSDYIQDENGYMEQSEDVVGMMFESTISCQDDDWYYIDYDSYVEMMQGDDGCRAVADDISESCGELFYNDFVPRKTSDCGTPQDVSEVLYSKGGDYYSQYDQARRTLSEENSNWYKYDISADNILDGATTCEVIQAKYKRGSSPFGSMAESAVLKWLAFAAGLLIGLGVILYVKKKNPSQKKKNVTSSKQRKPPIQENYVTAKEMNLQKLPKRTEKNEPDWAERNEALSPRSKKKLKERLSKAMAFVKSKSTRRQENDKEEPLVIIDKTAEDIIDSVLHYSKI